MKHLRTSKRKNTKALVGGILLFVLGSLWNPSVWAGVPGAPIQVGDVISATVTGTNQVCQSGSRKDAIFEVGTLSVSNVAISGKGFVFDAVLSVPESDPGSSCQLDSRVAFTAVFIDANGNFSAPKLSGTNGPPGNPSPCDSTFTVNLSGLLQSGGISASGSSLDNPPELCKTQISILGGTLLGQQRGEQAAEVSAGVSQTQTNFMVTTVSTFGGRAAVSPRKIESVSNSLTPVAGGVRYEGMSAGDGFEFPFGLWATYDHSDFDDDTGGGGLDGNTDVVLVGGDFSPWEGTAFGIAVGYEDSQMDTFFNGGDLEIDGFSVIPYAALYLSDHVGVDFDLAADFVLGFSSIDVASTQTVGEATVSGSADSTRAFFGGNLTAGVGMGALYVSGTGGFLMARDNTDGFVDSSGTVIPDQHTQFGQFSAGGEAAHALGDFEPYVNMLWMYAYEREESTVLSDDANSALLGLGVRYLGDQFSGTVSYSTILGRDDYSQDTISVQIRADF